MRRAVLVVALLALSATVAPVAAESAPSTPAPSTSMPSIPSTSALSTPAAATGSVGALSPMAAQTSPSISPSGTTFVVQLQADGDARWRVTTTFPLSDENETQAFRQFASSYEDGETAAGPNVTFFRTAADRASTVAGRNMTVENVTRNSAVGNGTGRLVLSFTWTNFLTREGRQLVLHDALLTPDNGTWLGFLGADQRLVVRTPPGYAINFTSDPVVQRNRSFIVNGPRDFDDDALTVRYTRSQETPPPPRQPPWPAIAAAGVVLAVVLVSALAWRRRGGSSAASGTDSGPDSGAGAAAGGEGGSAPGEQAAGEAGAEGGAAAGEAGAGEGEPDLTLLSDEEQVEHILEQHGGRMRQADIVAETDWSDAKVSQLLSKMADEGRVEKLRLGRENLISLPDGADGE